MRFCAKKVHREAVTAAVAATILKRGCLGYPFINKATADPNFTATNRVFTTLFSPFRPFWSGNSNTPDEL